MKPFPLCLCAPNGEVYELSLRPEVKLVAVLTAFCDETNTHEGPEYSFVGGYIFDADGERRFTEKWAEVLKPLRSRGIRYFRASACHAREKPFDNLSYAEKLAFFGDLILVIRETAKCGMVSRLEDKTFKELIARNKFQEFTGTKYTACAFRALTAIATWASQNGLEGQIAYRFESGNEHQPEADFMMREIENNPKLAEQCRYGGHSFEPKYSLLPLQAADLFIWMCQRMSVPQANRLSDVLPYWKNLQQEPDAIPHLIHEMGTLSVGMLAFTNMTYGIKSNLEYERQTGETKRYTI